MSNSISASSRFGEQTAADTMRSTLRELVIEDLDAPSPGGAALLSVCVVSAPAGTSLISPVHAE
ncbi:hypothetical protein ABTY53_30835 [Streptomyces noursei]|uniref:hypothetical protein n=1 Tax=Streptomyces noursei TaxID=1971 RepID=UPI00331FEC3D